MLPHSPLPQPKHTHTLTHTPPPTTTTQILAKTVLLNSSGYLFLFLFWHCDHGTWNQWLPQIRLNACSSNTSSMPPILASSLMVKQSSRLCPCTDTMPVILTSSFIIWPLPSTQSLPSICSYVNANPLFTTEELHSSSPSFPWGSPKRRWKFPTSMQSLLPMPFHYFISYYSYPLLDNRTSTVCWEATSQFPPLIISCSASVSHGQCNLLFCLLLSCLENEVPITYPLHNG